LTPEEFRLAGHELIDWIADYRDGIEDRPVLPPVKVGEIRGRLPDAPPTDTTDITQMLHDLESVAASGITTVQHPMHFGWFPSNASLSSVLGDIASSGLGSLGISWESSPALTEVEEVMVDWMRQLVGLSTAWTGSINDTASTACLVSLLVARERATDLVQNRGGLQSLDAPLTVYSTDQAHSSIAKAALLAGYGWDNIRMVDTDPVTRAMVPDALEAAITTDLATGAVPAAVVAGVGTTGVTAFDPVRELVRIAAPHDMWVHVDAAMAGTAMLVPEMRHLWDGVEGADAVSWNPHKWMGTILDTSLLYVRDTDLLQRVLATNPSYLQSPTGDEATQYRDWGIPLGRRFRSLKLWFHLRLDGIESIQERIRRDLQNARWLEGQVDAVEGWELVAPVTLQTVCVRHVPVSADGTPLSGDALEAHTLRWVRAINSSGEAFLSPSKLDNSWMVRCSIGTEMTERHHVERVWQMMQDAASAS